MSQSKENAASGQLAAGGAVAEATTLNRPEDTTKAPKNQNAADNGNEPLDYLEVGFSHGVALLDDIELGLDTTLQLDLDALNRVRMAHLTKQENEALNILLGAEIKQRAPAVQAKMLDLLGLKENFDDLAELAAAVGILPRGATWEEMVSLIGPISWAWRDWLPDGFLAIVAGEPGQGKSVLCLRIAASFIRGDPWPDDTPYEGEPGAVLWCEAEAAQALNLERAKTWGLPLDKIYTPLDDPLADVQLDQSEHLEAVTELAHRPEVRAVIVDSLRGIHRGDENSSASMEICKALAELARNTHKPILLTHHLRKRGLLDVGDRVNLDRIRGSSAIIQAARMVWAIDNPDVTEEDYKRLSVIKSNLARFPDPLGFTIGDQMRMTFGEAPEAPRQETQLDKAIDLLKALLANGPMASVDLRDEAEGAGLGWNTLKRAKDKIGVVARRDGQSKRWTWALPARPDIEDITH